MEIDDVETSSSEDEEVVKSFIISECKFAGDFRKEKVGEGANGVVYKFTLDGKVVALKQIKLDKPNLPCNRRLIVQEAKELVELDHVNIIKCFGVCPPIGLIVLELAEKEFVFKRKAFSLNSLRQLIDTVKRSFPLSLKVDALTQIASGLEYLKLKKVVHGDLKSGNVLLSGPDRSKIIFKLGDMGQAHSQITSRIALRSSTTGSFKKGTTSFEAPEVFLEKTKTFQSDIYSFAMVMYEMLYPDISFPWEKEFSCGSVLTITSGIMDAVSMGKRPYLNEVTPYTEIMVMCWDQQPEERPDPSVLRVHLSQLMTAGAAQQSIQTPSAAIQPAEDGVRHQIEKSTSTAVFTSLHLETSSKPRHQAGSCSASQPVGDGADGQSSQIEINVSTVLSAQNISSNRLPTETLQAVGIVEPIIEEPSSIVPTLQQSLVSVDSSNVIRTVGSLQLDQHAEDDEQVRHEDAINQDLGSAPEDLLMKWSGYAGTKMNIALRKFQVQALTALHFSRDIIIVEATGSGKSTCFQLPALMLKDEEFCLVIVPTVALGWDHLKACEDLGLSATYLGDESTKEQFEDFLSESQPVKNRPRVIILTPEKLFGNRIQNALSRLSSQLKFIAIDEVHLVFEWNNFRNSFNSIKQLKSLFACPILALSATLKPKDLASLKCDILRNPVLHKGSVNRPNVALHIVSYNVSISPDVDKKWLNVSKQIHQMIDGEKTIVYCDYAADCEPISIALSRLGLKCSSFTGKKTTPTMKNQIYSNMKNGNIDVLVATKAFGVGVNIPDIRHVIHMGIPQNLSCLVQESGRAGRDGHQAHSYVMLCEYQDIKKFKFWTTSGSQEEIETLHEDYVQIWGYLSAAFTGSCLRHFILDYFNDYTLQKIDNPQLCCTGCEINATVPKQKCELQLLQVLKCISTWESKLQPKKELIHENKIVEWLAGKETEKIWRYFNDYELAEETSFGFFAAHTLTQTELIVKGLLRQCLSLNCVTVSFTVLPNTSILAKNWILSELGRKILRKELELPYELPDPMVVASKLLRWEESSLSEKKSRSRPKKGNDLVSQVISLLEDDSMWTLVEERRQYEMLGFFHDPSKLLFVEDCSKLIAYPLHEPRPDFMWEDINLTKCSSFPKKDLKIGEEELVLHRAQCAGVKYCEGTNGAPCSFAVFNRRQENRCINHKNARLLKQTCDSFFIYIHPKDRTDNRRWLGLLSSSNGRAGHSHNLPIPSKVPVKVKQDICEALRKDPTKTAKELQQGDGIGYSPCQFAPAAADNGTWISIVGKEYKKTEAGMGARSLIENFHIKIKRSIDEKDRQIADNVDFDREVVESSSPYRRFFSFGDELDIVVLATPQMLQVLADSMFVQVDVTYPGLTAFKYLMNFVAYNELTMSFQVVGRVLMNRVNKLAYKTAFTELFKVATETFPEFENGLSVNAWVVDFSLAQQRELSRILGEKAGEHIRGCQVHFQRNLQKIADKVCPDEASKSLFVKIGHLIPKLDKKADLSLAFQILCGEKSLQDCSFLKLSEDELKANTDKWCKATKWAKWWSTPRIAKMFTKSCKEMTDADWDICPNNTNAVESHNKCSQAHSTMLSNYLKKIYIKDRNTVVKSLCAKLGVNVGVSAEKRKRINDQRRIRRKRPKLVCDEDEGSDDELMMSDDETTRGQFERLPDNPLSSSRPPSTKHVASSRTPNTKHVSSSRTPGTKHVSSSRSTSTKHVSSSPSSSTKHASSVSDKTVELCDPLPSSLSASAKTTDPHIGVACWVTTVDEDNKKYGSCFALIRFKYKSGEYKAVYPQWPGYFAKIPNIHDTKEVILQPKEKEEANADKSICDYCGEKLILS